MKTMSFLSDVHITCSEVLTDHAITRFKFDLVGTRLQKKKKKTSSSRKYDYYEPQEEKTETIDHLPKPPPLCQHNILNPVIEAAVPTSSSIFTETQVNGKTKKGQKHDKQETSSINFENFQEVSNKQTCKGLDRLNVGNKERDCRIYEHSAEDDREETEQEKDQTTFDKTGSYVQTEPRESISQTSQNECFTQTGEHFSVHDPGGSLHTNNTGETLKTNETFRTVQDEGDNIEYDSDGDLHITRKRDFSDSDDETDCFCVTIRHSLATELNAVGEQVWQGALLLCDYIIHQRSIFRGHCVVDLGAGTSLTSIVCAMFAEHVYCTDTGENVLNLAKSNIESAIDYFTHQQSLCPVDVKDLNWFTDLSHSLVTQQTPSVFLLMQKDLEIIKHAELLIAADVIYDDDITDAFFSTIKHLMKYPPNKTLFIALERRLVFTIEDLDVSSPGYNHFRSHLKSLKESQSDSKSAIKYTVEEIDTDFPQFSQYDRTVYLELWKITSKHTLDKT